jgi:hypothetical protein
MLRNPRQVKVLASASRTVAPTTVVVDNSEGARELIVTTSVTVPGTGSITTTVGYISASGVKVPLLSSTALTTAVVNQLLIGIDLTTSANAALKSSIPAKLYVDVAANNANAVTYSVDLDLLP